MYISTCTFIIATYNCVYIYIHGISCVQYNIIYYYSSSTITHYSLFQLSRPRFATGSLRNRGMHTFWLKACPYRCMEKPSSWMCRCVLYIAGCETARGIQ